MAVRVEPPRGRSASNYPGLTPEERDVEVPTVPVRSLEPEPPPPLWFIPSEVPRSSPSGGFFGPLPGAREPEPPPPEGLFDVPGLLERLWLARALEARRERPWSSTGTGVNGPEPDPAGGSGPLPTGSQSGGVLAGVPARSPGGGPAPRATAPDATPLPERPAAAPVSGVPPRPRTWICPHCYLTNDATATTCRGCRSGTLHL